jgi:hypothetical protein
LTSSGDLYFATTHVLNFDPVNMSKFIGFLFNPVTINERLKPRWVTILDHEYLQSKMIEPILNNVHLSQNLLQELIALTDHGQIVVKTDIKKITEPAPFSLTPMKVKDVVVARKEESQQTKAQVIPTGLFENNKCKDKIDALKKENKAKAVKGYEESQTKMFRAAQHKPAIVAKIRQKVLEEEQQRMTKAPVKPIPQFAPVSVKLTTASILKREMLIKLRNKELEKQLDEYSMGMRDVSGFEQWQEEAGQREKLEHQLKLEKKRLEVQMLHEDTFVAKQETIQANKEKAQEIAKSKHENQLASQTKLKLLEEENKKKVEYVNEIKQGIEVARKKLVVDKNKKAVEMAHESKRIMREIEMKKQQEMKEKQELIQQIKLIEKKNAQTIKEKEVDFTESSGTGLLGEMSLVEVYLNSCSCASESARHNLWLNSK